MENLETITTSTTMPTKKLDILVDCLRISGFRGIQNLEISFSPMTVLIGPNNSGKTTVLKALGLALGDYSRYVTEEDFYIGTDEQDNEIRAEKIVVDVRISSLADAGKFSQAWQAEFGDRIKSEADGKQYVAIRTEVSKNEIKGGFETTKKSLKIWPDFYSWQIAEVDKKSANVRFESVPFFSIEAQRDIHSELREKSSFVGKVLSGIEYDKKVISDLEKAIGDINKEAVDKSIELQCLKDHLAQLSQTFHGAGNAEITPFPKKVRGLSKNFSIHFGETTANTFAMEYHGMGTRSWASMLTVRAFMDILRTKHEKEVQPFFPIMAAEEPEAHLHPNAQKTLYDQLSATNAQVIVSTHSPYFTAMPDITNVRSLKKTSQGIVTTRLDHPISANEKKILAREILARRGEILFARALILCEGMTEEQIIPAMFEVFSGGHSLFSLGISCISVGGGKNYSPFIKLACSFGIPTFIIGDNDIKNNVSAKTVVENQIKTLIDNGLTLDKNNFGVSYCGNNNDFEAELLNVLKIRDEINAAFFLYKTDDIENPQYKAAQETEIKALTDSDILKQMSKAKTSYSGFLADIIRENPNCKQPNQLITQAAHDAFTAIKGWIPI
ncbi:MAG: AAA family ATPase [Legionella sp.]|jgi:putative ATP-dependent endonuclease of OLD family